MATYGERLPLAIDDLSDTEDVELGDTPPIVSDPAPPRFPPLSAQTGAYGSSSQAGGYGSAPPAGGYGSAPPAETYDPAPPVAELGERSALDDWADPATFGTTAPLTGPAPPTPTLNGARTPEVAAPGRTISPGSSVRRHSATVYDKLESLKAWSISTYKCSRQLIAERLGRSTRTVDAELDAKIAILRETQVQYRSLMKTAKELSTHLTNMLSSQMQLSELFSQLGQRTPELRQEFDLNAEAQRTLNESGRPLRDALAQFVSSMETLCEQTIEDALTTIKSYETARVEYDAYRVDLEWAGQQGGDTGLLAEARRQHDIRLAEYQRLREKVTVKLTLLDENRVKVLRNQLGLFHAAVSEYFSGDAPSLKTTLCHLSADSLGAGDAGVRTVAS
ncbi:arfaptin-2-like [Amphibalanus amphitrite]|uniref:arfaptin-2-like n=1 Tax=Amphibalanus amphitrite TaxID=1232801 RepID=UPI001C90016B|nr:arfaptin-2-like [Amphibalanus amphitrite]XP_043233971.1 arfaptin-2-like [Amphibalanus amphitrite]